MALEKVLHSVEEKERMAGVIDGEGRRTPNRERTMESDVEPEKVKVPPPPTEKLKYNVKVTLNDAAVEKADSSRTKIEAHSSTITGGSCAVFPGQGGESGIEAAKVAPEAVAPSEKITVRERLWEEEKEEWRLT